MLHAMGRGMLGIAVTALVVTTIPATAVSVVVRWTALVEVSNLAHIIAQSIA